jgi:predicted dehydrogenase
LDIAIIGAGLMGKWHAQTVRKLGAQVRGIVDVDEAAARTLASRFQGALWFTSVDELFSALLPEVVHICTPLPTHRTLCIASLDHGAHLVCEKPLAESAEEVRTLHEHAHKLGKQICPVHQFATQRGVLEAKRLLGGLGTISRVNFVICSAGADGQGADMRDIVVADILPHPLSVLSALWPANSLENLEWKQIHPAPGEVLAHCLFNDVPLSLAISMSGRPTRCYMEIQGSHGSLRVDFFHGFCMRLPGQVSKFRKMIYPLADSIRLFTTAGLNLAYRAWRREPAYPGLEQLLREFYLALEQGGEGPIPENLSISLALARDHFLKGMDSGHC